jgi:sec-independent protein translocase protein TatB
MFDIGALELLLIAVVALLVVGPERLPRLARTAGRWVGRARRAFLSVKDEIDREIKADELREILRKQSESRPLDTILEEGMGLSQSNAGPSGASGQQAASDADSGRSEPAGASAPGPGDDSQR